VKGDRERDSVGFNAARYTVGGEHNVACGCSAARARRLIKSFVCALQLDASH
jgi:hypothetical protein